MKTHQAVDTLASAELVRLLRISRVAPAEVVHDYGCPITKRVRPGPCVCPAGPIEAKIVEVYKRLGLACQSCAAYKAKNGSGHYMTCRYAIGSRRRA